MKWPMVRQRPRKDMAAARARSQHRPSAASRKTAATRGEPTSKGLAVFFPPMIGGAVADKAASRVLDMSAVIGRRMARQDSALDQKAAQGLQVRAAGTAQRGSV